MTISSLKKTTYVLLSIPILSNAAFHMLFLKGKEHPSCPLPPPPPSPAPPPSPYPLPPSISDTESVFPSQNFLERKENVWCHFDRGGGNSVAFYLAGGSRDPVTCPACCIAIFAVENFVFLDGKQTQFGRAFYVILENELED